jgi:hypothetical protein
VWEGAIEVTVKNISQRPVKLVESILTWELVVLDSSGKAVPLTDYGKQVEAVQRDGPRYLLAVAVFDLPPGQEYTRTLGLMGLFQLEPGEDYTVRLRRSPRSMSFVDDASKQISLRELSCTLKIAGRPTPR